MKVRGDLAPIGAFTLEEQPKKPGHFLVRFYENIHPFSDERDGYSVSGYEYDEYHLELAGYSGLADDISSNLDGYLAQAKLLEAETKTIPDLKQKVSDLEDEKTVLSGKVTTLETQLTDTQMALCDVYELALGGANG